MSWGQRRLRSEGGAEEGPGAEEASQSSLRGAGAGCSQGAQGSQGGGVDVAGSGQRRGLQMKARLGRGSEGKRGFGAGRSVRRIYG